jgi:hypothetical protein
MDRQTKEIGDGWTAAQLCLQAMAETEDLETKRSLWRAAVKYARKDWDRTASLEIEAYPVPARVAGEVCRAQFEGW